MSEKRERLKRQETARALELLEKEIATWEQGMDTQEKDRAEVRK